MSEAVAVELGLEAVVAASQALSKAFDAAKAKHDVGQLEDADRTMLIALVMQNAGMLRQVTEWVMSHPQSSNGKG